MLHFDNLGSMVSNFVGCSEIEQGNLKKKWEQTIEEPPVCLDVCLCLNLTELGKRDLAKIDLFLPKKHKCIESEILHFMF
jgi:hypothetical protein